MFKHSLKPYEKYNYVNYDYIRQLPESWELLPNIAVFGERISKGHIDEELLSISAYKGIIKSSEYEDRKDRTSDNKSEYLLVKNGDLAYNTMLMWAGAVGSSDFNGIVSPAYTVLKPKIKVNHKFFHYQYRTEFYKNYSKRFSYGIIDSRLRLYFVNFKRMYSIVPPFKTQNRIAEYLNRKTKQADNFIEKQTRLIELLKEQKKAIINKAVTKGLNSDVPMKDSGIEWLGEIPVHWEIIRLRYIGNCKNGVSQNAEYFGSGFPFVSYSDVYKNSVLPEQVEGLAKSTYSDRDNYSVKKGDVFFTRTSETMEEIGLTSTCLKTIENAIFAGFLIRFRPSAGFLFEGFSKYYFRSQLHRLFFMKEMNMVTRASLSQELLKKMLVIIPPFQEQNQIATHIETKTTKIDQAIQKAEKEIILVKEYLQSLIYHVVIGKLEIKKE